MEETLELIKNKLLEKKAEDVSIIDISDLSVMTDYFVIASGNNINQVHAMADFVEEELAKITAAADYGNKFSGIIGADVIALSQNTSAAQLSFMPSARKASMQTFLYPSSEILTLSN